MKKALVITPTTGAPEVVDAIESVKKQSYPHTHHLLVVDGEQYSQRFDDAVRFRFGFPSYGETLFKCVLPFNTGGGGFYGHRIMAAFSHLTGYDYILFLDQDNMYDANHVESLVTEIEKYKFDWCYSLRSIYDKDGKYVCDDNCESLGRWPVWVNDSAFLIDSSSYCFTNNFIRQFGHIWDHGWGADRRFYTVLKEHVKHNNYGCTGLHTLKYRLGGNEGSVQKEFFIEGNEKTLLKYGGKLPWLTTVK